METGNQDPKIFDRYNNSSEVHGYERITSLPQSYCDQVLDPFVSEVKKVSKNPRILDLASGSGLAANYFENQHGLTVVRTDLNRSGLLYGGTLRAQALADQLPFSNESFDGIHFKDGLVHVYDKATLLNEIHRTLKPGGRCVITTQRCDITYFTVRTNNPSDNPSMNNDERPEYFNIKIEGNDIQIYLSRKTPTKVDASALQQKPVNILMFETPQEYAVAVPKLEKTLSGTRIGPPYYRLNDFQFMNEAEQNGLELTDAYIWQRDSGEADWHDTAVKKLVLKFEKLV